MWIQSNNLSKERIPKAVYPNLKKKFFKKNKCFYRIVWKIFWKNTITKFLKKYFLNRGKIGILLKYYKQVSTTLSTKSVKHFLVQSAFWKIFRSSIKNTITKFLRNFFFSLTKSKLHKSCQIFRLPQFYIFF